MSGPDPAIARRRLSGVGGLLLCLVVSVPAVPAQGPMEAGVGGGLPPARTRGVPGQSVPPIPASSGVDAGPLFDVFPLTLRPGHGTEAAGPLYYDYEAVDESLWGIPPFVSSLRSRDGDRREIFVLPPLFSYRRYGEDSRWQFAQWLNGSRLDLIDDPDVHRFNLFPFFFYQNASDPEHDYWALFPLYGTLQNRFFRDRADFVLFPVWLETWKGTMRTRNILFPFFHLRDGPGLRGWQFWPLLGHEHKLPATRTNLADQVEVVPGHDKTFALWPIYFRNRLGLGTDNPTRVDAALPFYYLERSPKRDSTSVLWPFFSWADDRAEKYRQWYAPWPLVSFARGEGRTLDRVAPFFSVGHSATFEGESYLWPLYRRRHIMTADLDRDRHQFGLFLYMDLKERIKGTDAVEHRIDSWPLFTWRRDRLGNERLQVFAPVEPVRDATYIRRNWSPLWSVWRQERNAATGWSSQSLLWNFYRRDSTPAATKGSLLFGLVQYEKTSAGRRWRLFYLGPRLIRPKPEPDSNDHVSEPR